MIVRVCKNADNPFVMVNKTPINDPRLSWKAKGILVYLLSKPDHWIVRVRDIANHAKDGRESVLAGLRELREHGYAKLEQPRSEENGQFQNGGYTIYEIPITVKPETEEPQTEEPQTENPTTVNPSTENPTYSNNEVSKIESSKNESSNIAAPDFLEGIVEFSQKMDKNNDRPKGWREATDPEYQICVRVASLWTNDKLSWSSSDIEKSLAAANQLLKAHDDDLRATICTLDRYHLEEWDGNLMVTGPYSLRNIIPAYMGKRKGYESKGYGSKGLAIGPGENIGEMIARERNQQ